MPVPATTGGSKSILFGVANLGGGNVWAAGNTVPAGGNNRAFATHRS